MTDASVERPDLSLVLERITDGFIALDANWRVSYMNAEARKMLHAQEDVIGMFWLEAFPRARGRAFEREYQRAMRDQQPVQFTEYSQTANCWFEVKAYPSRDGLSVYFRDVTARIEAQREVERNARRQQAIIDFSRSALSGITTDEIISDAMDLLREILDTPVIEMYDYDSKSQQFSARRSIGWGLNVSLDCAKPLTAHLMHVVRTGEPFVCPDVRIDPRARGLKALAQCNVLSLVAVLIGTQQSPLGAFVAYYPLTRTYSVGDVRFAQSVAQSVAETSTAVESTRRTKQVLESIRDAFVAVDRNMRVTYVNRQMSQYWHMEPEEAVGQPITDFTKDFDYNGVALKAFTESVADGKTRTYEQYVGDRYFETRLYPYADGVAAYTRDITRRKTEEDRINQLNAELELRVAERTHQLELSNKELESFSYSVSHDLRAPLRAIDGFSQALLEDYAESFDTRAQNYLDRVRKAAQRMADLIDALLGLAKVARAPMKYVPVDLTTIGEDLAREMHENEPGREVEIVVEPGMRAMGEPALLRTVVQNLFGNAWKFTRNTASPRIEFSRAPEGGFTVRDNGAGFDMAYENKLFGAFQRLHSTEEYEGTGIGLATVARIIHRHGGEIRADGAIDKGAAFTFTLPAVKEESQPAS